MREVAESETINLRATVAFVRRNLSRIALFCIVGALCSTVYLVVTPFQYGTQLLLRVAQASETTSINLTSNTVISLNTSSDVHLSTNASEETEALVQRLYFPGTYSESVRDVCDLQEDEFLQNFLTRNLVAHAVRNSTVLVEIAFHRESIEKTRKCAKAVVEMISEQQAQLIKEKMAGRVALVAQYEQAFNEQLRKLAAIKDKHSDSYVAGHDQLSWLRMRMNEVQEALLLSSEYPTKLVAPIFVSSQPIAPNISKILLLGMLLGGGLGILLSMMREKHES